MELVWFVLGMIAMVLAFMLVAAALGARGRVVQLPPPPPPPSVVVAAEGRVVVSVGPSDRVGVLPSVDVRQVEPRALSGRMGA